MRIVIDMQGAQASNRQRGIGRYTMAFTQAVILNRGEHEIILALSGLFPETIEPIRAAFDGLLPQSNIRVWDAPASVAFAVDANHWRRHAAELIREAFLASLRPDVVHVSSLFEGLRDDAVTSVGLLSKTVPTAVTLFDLIPYIHRKPYLENPTVAAWYFEKIDSLRRSALWLAISESSRQEGIEQLGLSEEWVVNISTDADAYFQRLSISAEEESFVRSRYGLNRPFVMYTGGIDHRKNIEGLIRAFSKLPQNIREAHQLAIVCSAQPESRRALEELAAKQGLGKDALILTGFVPEEDLRTLYNLCSLFVFPSWHEGFGLPALEAMRCGAPVIGANTSSLPEVIGWKEALFDPRNDEEVAKTMARALSDEGFRAGLVRNAKVQSEKFSWDETAKRAITAMENLHSARPKAPAVRKSDRPRPKLAYVSPLPPERSGIADYSAELLPELARHYEIDVIVTQETIDDPWINASCSVRSAQWFAEHADHYDRVLYHFGNSAFHQHMFDLLKAVPGIVVLHDFFLSGVVAHMEVHGCAPGRWAQELYFSHGYQAPYNRFHAKDTAHVVWDYPCSLSVIQESLGLIAHSPYSLRLARQWYGGEADDWEVIPLMRDSRISTDRAEARKALGLDAGDFLVCAFGMLGPTKLNHRLLNAWLESGLAQEDSCHLVFVGENHPGDYGQERLATIRRRNARSSIRITGWADRELFQQYLAAADAAVQLRTLSRGETSAAVLDCMNHGLPTVVNANGSMADLDAEAVWKLPDEFADEQLIDALETLWRDSALRRQMGRAAREIIEERHDSRKCADLYSQAIERFYDASARSLHVLPDAIAGIPGHSPEETDLVPLAEAIAHTFPPRNRSRQLLVDISELVKHDVGTGIQRVVRNILYEWLHNPPQGYRVEPVYATVDHSYRYARGFTTKFLCIPENVLQDEPIDYAAGDVFLGLDLQPQVVPAQRAFYQALRRQGVKVEFVVYDLLCVLMPQYFVPGAAVGFTPWLEVVAESDGVVCISKAVARELDDWVGKNGPVRQRPFKIDWFHLGAEFDHSHPTQGLPHDKEASLAQLQSRPTFLMVGTIEPRKGHTQVLDAFEQLWQSAVDVNLVIVGKQGWLVERLIERLHAHPKRENRLFWLEGISDEYLEKLYAVSACLIAASYGEGFGLPLIEAAQHKLPIIARDISVFREVAGDHAYYFDSKDSDDLVVAIKNWLALYEKGNHPTSDKMPWLTWKESAAQLLNLLIGDSEHTATLDVEMGSKRERNLTHQT
jgi:glycosyltransferase involved in cell wall biosynthesis